MIRGRSYFKLATSSAHSGRQNCRLLDAVRAAIDVQRAMTIRNADFVPEKRIEFRAKESR
jgi:class 3 adenylate cyclase